MKRHLKLHIKRAPCVSGKIKQMVDNETYSKQTTQTERERKLLAYPDPSKISENEKKIRFVSDLLTISLCFITEVFMLQYL
jgi:hypothetical protein